MSTILIVDDKAIFRDPIAASLEAAGYATTAASGGREALVLMKQSRPDLVLLDIAMPEMDGLNVLKVMRADARLADVPVILLTAVSDKKHVLQAASMGAAGYLLKSQFRLADLLERVQKHIRPCPELKARSAGDRAAPADADVDAFVKPSLRVASPPPALALAAGASAAIPGPVPTGVAARVEVPQLLTREQSLERAKNALQGKTLSGVVAQVIALAASPRCDLKDLLTLISRDAMLSSRVLRTANSSAYSGGRGMITTLSDAVRTIGSSGVRDITAGMGIFDAMPEARKDGFNPFRCWQHSFAVAQLCARLYHSEDGNGAGTAYLVGLCHDLGDILFHTHFGAEYEQVKEMQERSGRSRAELEQIMLGTTQRELAGMILRQLGLPEHIRRPVEDFHATSIASNSMPRDPLAKLLYLAKMYANGAMLASSESSQVGLLPQALCREITGQINPDRPDSLTFRNEISTIAGLLARLNPRDEARLTGPLFPRRKARICLARDPRISAFDPIFTALESLADVEVRDRLPRPEEADGFAGLIVTTRDATSGGFSVGEVQALRAVRPDLPLLWITLEPIPSSAGGLQPLPSPVPLSQLAAFVEQAAQAAQVRPQAA